MTRTPNFDELIGTDIGLDEREQLERVHDLLVIAGPPPELTPEMESGPTLGMTLGKSGRRRPARRVTLLAAAVVVIALAFLAGFTVGNSGSGIATARTLRLVGTPQAPTALASLRVQPRDEAGNWPMILTATGLPKLPRHAYYAVFVTRHGKIFAPCGIFVVRDENGAVSVRLNAPYKLRAGDGWVVTKETFGADMPGPVVLKQIAT
jgi:Anti-sigma-K factor rskA